MLDRFSSPCGGTGPSDPFNLALAAEKDGDIEAAETLYRESAGRGNTRAMVNLGVMLIDREGSGKEAVSLFEKAAGLGDSSGMRNMGYV
ncbi:MAG: hypothetical protein LBU30_04975, partial [Candidatus Methanoplasma sp.]|nr:hypothetical protein [Candidatus Methanoplasma sp.]